MRLVYEATRGYGTSAVKGRSRVPLQAGHLRMVCKNKDEFFDCWSRIKYVGGIKFDSVRETPREYSAVVITVHRQPGESEQSVKDRVNELRKMITDVNEGKYFVR